MLESGDEKLIRGANFWQPATVVAAARAMSAVVSSANGGDDALLDCGRTVGLIGALGIGMRAGRGIDGDAVVGTYRIPEGVVHRL